MRGTGAFPVIVIGASARAAMQSLARAGLSGTAIDLFGDRDLQRLAVCIVCSIPDFPFTIPHLLSRRPSCPVIYTGGLENYPVVLSRIARTRPLWGNSKGVLDFVRHPFLLRQLLPPEVLFPSLIDRGFPAPTGGRWLRKPFRSSGGHGIRIAMPGEKSSTQHYFQQWVEGDSFSAQFVSSGNSLEFLGVTRQLIGESWLHARPFAYCGNMGPVELAGPVQQTLVRLGSSLSLATGLRGLWGLDFILQGSNVYPLEINPRYTAAIEVLELARGFSGMRLHGNCFLDSANRLPLSKRGPLRGVVGKAIYFAPQRIVFPSDGPWETELLGEFDPWRIPAFADIPHPGSVIEGHDPVLTIFAMGLTPLECQERLQSSAGELDRLYAGATS